MICSMRDPIIYSYDFEIAIFQILFFFPNHTLYHYSIVSFVCRLFPLFLCKQALHIMYYVKKKTLLFLISFAYTSLDLLKNRLRSLKISGTNIKRTSLIALRRHLRPLTLGFQTLGKFYEATTQNQKV